MKALVDRLAIGKIEYEIPQIELSVAAIEQTVAAGNCFNGSFKVDSLNGIPVKGLIYSTNSRLKIEKEQFGGMENKVSYSVDTHYTKEGDSIRGEINIVTNGGEFRIPFEITIAGYGIQSSIGEIENYFHFANLVQMNYEEALKFFASREFKKLLNKNDVRHLALYEGLIQSMDKKLALEEFLIAINKKKPVILSLAQDEMFYENLEENYGDSILISRNTWGYTDISVEVKGAFLKECRGRIKQDDFNGNTYEYRYLIDTKYLYKGINYGEIIFKSHNQVLRFEIKIDLANHNRMQFNRNVNDKIIKIVKKYLDFRMKKCNLVNWANESLTFVEGLLHLDNTSLMAWLFKAQILISQEKLAEAGELLDDFIKNKLIHADKNLDVYCYYLYVRSLEKREAGFTKTALTEVRKIYEQGNSWKNLWVIFYLDERYEINKSLKYTMIKEQFSKGCRSPYMYFEALNVLNEQPRLLRIFNNFELQVLLFGSKYGYINDNLAKQLIDLALTEKRYSRQLIHILAGLYSKEENVETLTAICGLLIRGNKTKHSYFKWYEAGITADVRLTNLYEYYMFSMDEEYDGLLPKMIYMYFIYNGEALGTRQAFLYSNIIKNKKKIPNIYHNYLSVMEQFLVDQLYIGNMSGELAVIYQDILKSTIINTDIAKNLPDIVLTYELTCDDPDMKEVVVIHKETTGESVYKLNNQKAYVHIYTQEPVILFVDTFGKRYANITYKLVQLLKMQEYLKQCFELHKDNKNLLLHFSEKYMKYRKNPLDSVDVYKNMMNYPNIRLSYKREVMHSIVDYYYEHQKESGVREELLALDKSVMDEDTRRKTLEMMIDYNLYEAVFEEIKKYGYTGILTRQLAVFTAKMIERSNKQYDSLLVELCKIVFRDDKYNEDILEYLSRFFYGTLDEMIKLWEVQNDFVYENHNLEERILAQTMFTKNTKVNLHKIFKSYYRNGTGKMVKVAFYTFCSYHTFMGNMGKAPSKGNKYVFQYLLKDILQGVGVPNICNIALLENASEKEHVSGKEAKLYAKILYHLSNYNINFEFYKKFEKWFELPFNVTDKTIIDYRTLPDSKVHISYTLGNKDEESRLIVEELNSVMPGIYTKEFTLFYGDKLDYYINEVSKEEDKTTDRHTIRVVDASIYKDNSRFSMINNIMIAKENNDKDKETEIMKEYAEKQQIAEQIFYIF